MLGESNNTMTGAVMKRNYETLVRNRFYQRKTVMRKTDFCPKPVIRIMSSFEGRNSTDTFQYMNNTHDI